MNYVVFWVFFLLCLQLRWLFNFLLLTLASVIGSASAVFSELITKWFYLLSRIFHRVYTFADNERKPLKYQ